MEWYTKTFGELSALDLFEIYRLRNRVFIVEQNCAYQDVDHKDLEAVHLFGRRNRELVSYSRLLPPGLSYPQPSIGRVVVDLEERGRGTGRQLMKLSIHKTLELFNNQEIVISAQHYLQAFYQSLGFVAEGDIYPEDDIPHIRMRYTRPES